MSDELPSREAVRHSDNIHDFPTYLLKVLLPLARAWQSGRLVDRDAMTPMYRQGGISGAWYRETDGDPPDGWLAIEDST